MTCLKPLRKLLFSTCRTLFLTIRGFISDRCTLQASALTYITLVSIVPILAITLSFCKGVGMQQKIYDAVGVEAIRTTNAENVEEITFRFIESSDGTIPKGKYTRLATGLPKSMQNAVIQLLTYVDKTNFAALGIIGLLTLLFTVVMSIKKLEDNFNAVWCIRKGRSLPRQFSEYLVMLLLMPIITITALSLETIISADKIAAATNLPLAQVTFWTDFLTDALILVFVVGAFVFLYIFMPNTKVRFVPALIAGTVTALVWGGVLWVYIHWQVGLARFNAIYGTFAALPFFLGWLYAEWVVVLAGAELCYSLQNHTFLRGSKAYIPLDPGANYLLGLAAMESICFNYNTGKGAWNAAQYAMEHPVSVNELEFNLNILKQNGLVIQLSPEADNLSRYDYVPARPPAELTGADVYLAFMGLESGRAAKIAAGIPTDTLTKLKKQNTLNLDYLKTINFAKK